MVSANTPLTREAIPHIKEEDVDSALNGLKRDIGSITEVEDDVKNLLLYHIDTWFPAFEKEII